MIVFLHGHPNEYILAKTNKKKKERKKMLCKMSFNFKLIQSSTFVAEASRFNLIYASLWSSFQK